MLFKSFTVLPVTDFVHTELSGSERRTDHSHVIAESCEMSLCCLQHD